MLGRPSVLAAALREIATGMPIVAATLLLEGQASGGSVSVQPAVTDEDGVALFNVLPTSPTTYRATFAGDAATRPSTSTDVELTPFARRSPGPVDAAQVFPSDHALRVTWKPPYDDGGDAPLSYQVTLTGSRSVSLTTTGTEVTFSGLYVEVYRVVIQTRGSTFGSAGSVDLGTWSPVAASPPVAGTAICGTQALGTTTWSAAGSPYQVCTSGVTFPLGSRLLLDGSDGRVVVSGAHTLITSYGEIHTASTSVSAPVELRDVSLRLRGVPVAQGAVQQGPTTTAAARLSWITSKGVGPVQVNATFALVDHLVIAGAGINVIAQMRNELLAPPYVTGLEVFASGAASLSDVSVRDVIGPGIHVSGASVEVRRAVVARAGSEGLRAASDHLLVQQAVVTASGTNAMNRDGRVVAQPAVRLFSPMLLLGASDGIADITGAGNALDAMVLSGRFATDTTWPNHQPSAAVHPLGWVGADLTVPAGANLLVPPGTTMVNAGTLEVEGSLTVQEGSVLTSPADPRSHLACPSVLATMCVGPGQVMASGCPPYACSANLGFWFLDVAGTATVDRSTVDHVGRAGVSGGLRLTNSAVTRSLRGITAAPGSTLEVVGSWIRWVRDGAGITATDANVRIERTVVQGTGAQGITLAASTAPISVVDTLVADTGQPGLSITAAGPLDVHGLTVRRARGTAAMLSGTGWAYGEGEDVAPLVGGGSDVDAVELAGDAAMGVPTSVPVQQSTDHRLAVVASGTTASADARALASPALTLRYAYRRDASAVIGWDGGYRTNGVLDIAVSGQSVRRVTTSQDGYAVTGLVNGTTYGLRVRLVQNGQPGRWSNLLFARPESPPDHAVITSSSVSPSVGALLARWQTGSTVWVAVSGEPLYGVGTSSDVATARADAGVYALTLRGLHPEWSYRLRLQPYDVFGTPGPPVVRTVAGTQLASTASRTLLYGQSYVLAATLTDGHTHGGLAGHAVRLTSVPTAGGTSRTVGTFTTDSAGTVRYRAQPGVSTRYTFTYAGSSGRMATARSTTLNVTR